MNISFYTIDDLSLGYDPKGVTGYRLSQFLCLEDALIHYRDLSASKQKALGLTDGTHVLPLVECCRLFSTDHEGEDVLASDFRMLPLWAELPEAAEAEHICITELRLRYVIRGPVMVPIPPQTELPKQYQDKYLWLSHGGGDLSAVRWVYAAGRGWCSVSIMDGQKDLRPLILKYRADGLTAQGAYHALEVEPWEYDLLLSRTKERLAKNMKEEKDHEKADRT